MGGQVLVVDDDPGVQKLLKTMLEMAHFEALIANNGQEALVCLEHTRPALIVLDLMMPTMDGPTFLAELERCGLRASTPVIVLTANIYARPLIERMHVDSYVSKPFRLTDLLQQIRTLVAQYQSRR